MPHPPAGEDGSHRPGARRASDVRCAGARSGEGVDWSRTLIPADERAIRTKRAARRQFGGKAAATARSIRANSPGSGDVAGANRRRFDIDTDRDDRAFETNAAELDSDADRAEKVERALAGGRRLDVR
ncbi:hypothetical protein [Burkholderia sp. ABCPW 14]|uniref:hypothetical protein n=1 Tax=Burkholderia sp. ABCPW 14 TaxID=1637860 RepID=UPI0018D24B28|nr:hypothetical protein [Burkholderia sp. ABCPW 14]